MPKQKTSNTSLLWLFFSPFGRISREVYWLALGLMWSIWVVVINFIVNSMGDRVIQSGTSEIALIQVYSEMMTAYPLLIPFGLFSQFAILMLMVKRLQDRGITGFAALALYLPFINIFIPFIVGFLKSEPGPNRYGPCSNSRAYPKKK